MRTLIYSSAVAVALAFAVPISADYASAHTGFSPHIDGAVQFPPTRWRIVRHTIRLHLPQGSSPLSQLIIDVPEGLTVSNNITINDNLGRKVIANFSVTDNKIIVNFSQPIASESELKLNLNNVKRRGISNAWIYQFSAKFVGVNVAIPIGTARIRVY
ncbi:MAG: hypothetical protein AB1589_35735 [Cyanobacteriota bacterium]